MVQTVLDAFADLLGYPPEDLAGRLATTHRLLESVDADAARAIGPLLDLARQAPQGDVEELYTRSFDMNPTCALELGWHLYGEDYDRGAFLVTVRDLMRRHGVEETGELPDHITHVLRLLGRLEEEEAGHFARRQALPALERILSGFSDEAHPYRVLLVGVQDVLTSHFGPADKIPASAFACPAPYEEGPVMCSGAAGCSGAMPPGAPPPSAAEANHPDTSEM